MVQEIQSMKAGKYGKDGLDYQFQQNDTVILGWNFLVKNVKMNMLLKLKFGKNLFYPLVIARVILVCTIMLLVIINMNH